MPAWQALDANRDGAVAVDELHPLQARVMKNHDADDDAMISISEYVSFNLDPGAASRIPIPENVRVIEDLPYTATGDPRQQVDVYLPKQPLGSSPLPVVAYIHGGGWALGSKISARAQVLPLVETGRFAAVSIGYRLSWQENWPAQIHDVKAGIRWIRAHAQEYGFDPARICAFGPSAGGHLVAMLGTTNGVDSVEGELGEHTRQSSEVQCVVDFFGPTDLRGADALDPQGNPSVVTKLLGGPANENPELAAQASPLFHLDASDVPFLIVHGTKDSLVNYSDSVELDAALRKAGVPVVFLTIEGGGHGDFGLAITEVNARVDAFLEKTLYDQHIEVASDTLHAAP
jgi:acetyl esterase/lipase